MDVEYAIIELNLRSKRSEYLQFNLFELFVLKKANIRQQHGAGSIEQIKGPVCPVQTDTAVPTLHDYVYAHHLLTLLFLDQLKANKNKT